MVPNFKNSQADLTSPPRAATSSPPSLGARLSGVPSGGVQRNITSVLGPDLTITGNIIAKGEAKIDGEIHGDVHGTYVIVGAQGRITGGIIAEEIVVGGQVMGSIRGTHVMLQSSSQVEADISYESLVIEQGASFEGRSQRSHNPTTDFVPPERAAAAKVFPC
jgi:cytoskeletal protein CcmA (bactofilin family)